MRSTVGRRGPRLGLALRCNGRVGLCAATRCERVVVSCSALQRVATVLRSLMQGVRERRGYAVGAAHAALLERLGCEACLGGKEHQANADLAALPASLAACAGTRSRLRPPQPQPQPRAHSSTQNEAESDITPVRASRWVISPAES